MSWKGKLIKTFVFTVIGIVLFFTIQNVVTPQWTNDESPSRILEGFELLEENQIDVLCLGVSHILYGVSPMKVYEDSYSCWYNLGSPGQPLECSYFLARKAFQTQKPKAIVLDVSSLFYTDVLSTDEVRNSYWRMLLDRSKLDVLKIEMMQAYAEMPFGDGVLSVICPIIKYHTRWKSLDTDDFVFQRARPYYSAGMYITGVTNPAQLTLNYVDETVDDMIQRNDGTHVYYDGNDTYEERVTLPLYAPSISEHNSEYINKLRLLCQENDSKLILVKIPVLQYPQLYSSSWTKYKSDKVKEIAEEMGIPFFDLMYDYTNVVDFNTDTIDGGVHLNIRGAEKCSIVLEEILSQLIHLSPKQNKMYDSMLQQYRQIRDVAILQSETDVKSYFELLGENADKWTILIACQNEYTLGISESDFIAMSKSLNLQLLSDGGYSDSYIAIVSSGKVLHEAVSNRSIDYSTDLDAMAIRMYSSGWLVYPKASIEVNGIEYVQGDRGINIVVYDNMTKLVIDSVAFDTHLDTAPAIRDWWEKPNGFLRSYESQVCFGKNSA